MAEVEREEKLIVSVFRGVEDMSDATKKSLAEMTIHDIKKIFGSPGDIDIQCWMSKHLEDRRDAPFYYHMCQRFQREKGSPTYVYNACDVRNKRAFLEYIKMEPRGAHVVFDFFTWFASHNIDDLRDMIQPYQTGIDVDDLLYCRQERGLNEAKFIFSLEPRTRLSLMKKYARHVCLLEEAALGIERSMFKAECLDVKE